MILQPLQHSLQVCVYLAILATCYTFSVIASIGSRQQQVQQKRTNFRGELNNYKQKGIISEPVYEDSPLAGGAFQCSVRFKLISTSQEIVGKGSPESVKASAKESAAEDAWNKIQAQGS